ncbi:MAG: radical SAM protein, partial [Limisphaerales bacterium]
IAQFPMLCLSSFVTTESFVPTIQTLRASGKVQTELHERAAATAAHIFQKQVFVRAVVEISNFCRENCSYCGMRRDNRKLNRVRANPEQLAELILNHRPNSVTDINIQAGEDPIAVREVALPLIDILRRETNLGVSVCLGTLNPRLYSELRQAGASIYIIKFEIGDRDLYTKMQSPGTYDERLENIRYLANSGWRVSSGFIAGLPGQTDEQMLKNFQVAAELPLDGCSVSPFIPGDETPWASEKGANIDLTLNSMAALRLMRPEWVIPAVSALNISEPGTGYRRGLRTGANLVTINMTPGEIRDDYLLYKRDRFIMTEERILSAIAAENLTPSKVSLAEFYRKNSVKASPIQVAA